LEIKPYFSAEAGSLLSSLLIVDVKLTLEFFKLTHFSQIKD